MTIAQQDTVAGWIEPGPAAQRGTLIVLPGRGESPEIYERFGLRLAGDAYRVHAVSAPSDDPARALQQVHELVEAADPALPRIVVGSDAGAAYAAHLAANGALPGVAALVLAGLPTIAAATAIGDWDAELDARTACSAHRARISTAGVRAAELSADLPAEWLDPSVPSRITVPVLGVHGGADAVSPVGAARRWYADVPAAEFVTIAGGRHDALNDQTHRTVAATIVLFLERLRGGVPLRPIAVTETLEPRPGVAS